MSTPAPGKPVTDAVLLSAQFIAPLLWRAGATPTADAAANALRVLATAAVLGERAPAINEDAMGLELELARLHQKTQLLIELLAVALARDGSRPAGLPLCLSAAGCSWQSHLAPARGSTGVLALWLHPACPEPLEWPAEIVELEPLTEAGMNIHTRLLSLGEAAHAALDRQVFLLHRRAIAEARAQRQ